VLEFRRAGVSGPKQRVAWQAASAGGGVTSQIFVPVDETETFVYDRTDAMASSSQFVATLEGYIR
jgi:hypothetical protein